MDLQKNNIMAASPQDWWFTFFAWLKDNTILFMVFALGWKAIDKVFKYFSAARDAELRKIVHDEMNPSIKELSDKISQLGEAIWGMKQAK